jgi:protein-tyrosine phosphatase
MSHPPTRICFVCLGNICRSPTAAAVMEHLVAEAGLAGRIVVESAGTGGWHVGDGPDRRAAAEARRRGIALHHTARRFTRPDFARFDLVLAMDEDNRRDLAAIAPDADAAAKIRMLRSFDPHSEPGAAVPDPYYGGPDGFAHVFDLVERACRGLLDSLEP